MMLFLFPLQSLVIKGPSSASTRLDMVVLILCLSLVSDVPMMMTVKTAVPLTSTPFEE